MYLVVNYGTHNSLTDTACDSYTWHSVNYTESGDYTFEYNNASGCASVDTLHLTINATTNGTEEITECETYSWHGISHATSGTYTYSYTNAAGCPSVDTLHLTINYGTHNVVRDTACETYSWHGDDYTTSGMYTYSYANASSCASVDTLYVVVNPILSASVLITSNDIDNTICVGGTITFNAAPTNGGTSPTYQWQINGMAIEDSINVSFTPNNLLSGDVISVVMTSNASPCLTGSPASSDPVTVTINSLPTIEPIIGDTIVCSTSSNLSSVTDGGIWSSSYDSIATISMYGVVLKINTGNTIITYTVTDANACTSQISTLFSFVDPTAAPDSLYGITELCSYVDQLATVTFYVKPVPGANSYDWYLPDGINATTTSERLVHGAAGSDSIVVNVTNSFYSWGAIYVSAVTAQSCNSDWVPLWIYKTKPVLGNITGSANVCFQNNADTAFLYHVDAIASGGSVTQYNWELPAGAAIDSGVGTNTIKVRFTKSSFVTSYIKVSAVSNCGTSYIKQFRLTKLVSSTPGLISGPVNPCKYIGTGDTATYSIRKIDGSSSYLWTMPLGATAYLFASSHENDTIIKVVFNSSFVSGSAMQVQSVGCNASAQRSLILTKANPTTPSYIAGVTNVCSVFSSTSSSLSDSVLYTTNRVDNATTYTWTIPANVDSLTTLTNRDTFIYVKFRNTFTTGLISVKGVSPCGASTIKYLTVNRLIAATPGAIQKTFTPSVLATTNVSGMTTDTLRIRKVTNATSYLWRMTSGSLSTTFEHINASGLAVNDTAVVVHLANGFTKDTLAVSALTKCNMSAAKTLILSALAIPSNPIAITDSLGNRIPCIGDSLPYRASASIPTATQSPVSRYRWTLPIGARIGSANPDSSLVWVRYIAGFVGGNISVKSVSSVGILSAAAYSITLRYALATPTAITSSTGNFAACIGDPISYAVVMPSTLTTVQRAASVYRWTIPNYTTITSAALDSSSITLQYLSGFTGGSIAVKAQSACGIQGTAKSVTLTFALAAAPTAITSSTGNLAGCVGGTINYTVTPRAPSGTLVAAASFRWTKPNYTTITSANSDSSVITLQFNVGYTSGALTAKGQSACGSLSTAKSISLIAPYSAPTPTSVTSSSGNFNACINTTKTYTVSSPSPSSVQLAAVKYRWTVPANTIITGASTAGGVDSASITVQFNASYTGGTLTVRGITACGGIGAVKSTTLTHTGCPSGTGALIAKETEVNLENMEYKSMEILISPNPTSSFFKVNVLNASNLTKEKVGVKVFDVQGRMIKTATFNAYETLSFGNELKPGIYLIQFNQGDIIVTKRVIKF